jgi:osmoprotectant transport system substrate-binding protein
MTTLRKLAVLAATSGLALTIAACGSSGGSGGGSSAGGSSSSANKGSITIGSANFTESELIARMYGDALTNAGYTVTVKANIGNREVYIKALESGEIDVVPEYVGTVTEYYNAAINGADAATNKPIATSDPVATDKALNTLIASRGLIASPTSPAADQNAFAVTQAFAKKNNVSSLSDLKKLNGTLVLGGPPECPTRPFCELGL